MPIEPMEGASYISDLNERWPLGSDEPSGADDHLRGIKNCVKNTFPNLDGPVTKTVEELNAVSTPSGTVMLFYQRSPPTGWNRVSLPSDYMVRAVQTTSGGSTGGSDNPIRMSKVPVHTHSVVGNTQDYNHDHGGYTANDGAHNHLYTSTTPQAEARASGGVGFTAIGSQSLISTYPASPSTHRHVIPNNQHVHAVGIESHANVGSSAGEWAPRYANVIICSKR